jgi:hypothetical protein
MTTCQSDGSVGTIHFKSASPHELALFPYKHLIKQQSSVLIVILYYKYLLSFKRTVTLTQKILNIIVNILYVLIILIYVIILIVDLM